MVASCDKRAGGYHLWTGYLLPSPILKIELLICVIWGYIQYNKPHENLDTNYRLRTKDRKAETKGRFAPFFVSGG
jgi:hypothetical protein